jgi:hypothetical protein
MTFDIERENLVIRKRELELDVKRINDNLSTIDYDTEITLLKLRRDIEGAKQACERSKERYYDNLCAKEAELEEIKNKLTEKDD